ncbi:ABC transporter substrate-binding protein [Actinopolymorpha rutila]
MFASRNGQRRYRHWAAVSGLCVLALVAAACSQGTTPSAPTTTAAGKPVKGGTLNMLGSGDVDYMDPNVSYYAIGYLGLRMWSRQLFTYPAENGKVTTSVPDLAEEIPTADNKGISADGKTYTISIRQGAQWNSSPARQVTAADMVRGVKRTCNPVQPFGGIPNFADLIVGYQKFCDGFAKVGQSPAAMAKYINDTPLPGVAAKDERTVVFKLTHPATYFVDMLTLPAFSPAPKEFLKYAPASLDLAKNTLSDGPYAIKTYSPTKQIVFERNPAWKASSDPVRKAYVDKIVVNQTVSQESTQQQLQTGSPSADMEWDNFPPPSQLPQLIAKKDPNLNLGETGSSNPYIVFNTVSPNNSGALKKPEVRQALAYAVNRTNIIQALGGPKVNPPLTHVLPSSIVGSKDFDPYPHNVAKAKQLLAKAGYKKGLTLKFVYRNASEGSRKTFATVQQDLKAVGVDVKGVAVPNADFYTKYMQAPDVTKRGVWDVSLAGWGSDWYGNAALSFFAPLFSGKPSFPPIGSNFGFYENPAVNKLITQASNAKDESTAGSLWAQADQQVMKDAPFFPITNPVQANYHASQTKNAVYLPSMQNFDPTNIWLEQGKQGG